MASLLVRHLRPEQFRKRIARVRALRHREIAEQGELLASTQLDLPPSHGEEARFPEAAELEVCRHTGPDWGQHRGYAAGQHSVKRDTGHNAGRTGIPVARRG